MQLPFTDLLGIEVTEIGDGRATGRLPLREELSSNPNTFIAHGGVTYSLADTIGGAAAISVAETVTPTVDMRIDYLAPATCDVLHCEAEVVRFGGNVSTVDIVVTDGEDTALSVARGTYKTGGAPGDSPWLSDLDGDRRSSGQ